MSRTRNQRRRDVRRIFEIIILAVLTIVLIGSVATCAMMWRQIEQITKAQQERHQSNPVLYTGSYLPSDFNEQAYRDACQRYAVENNLLIPDFNAKEGK